MNDWILLVPSVAFGLLALAMALVAVHYMRLFRIASEAADFLRCVRDDAWKQRDEARSQRDKLNTTHAQLYAENERLNEELTEALATVKMLQMQTVEVESIEEPKPVPKRPRRKKAEEE